MQQTTNISSTFSEYCTGCYRFAFNGKEKDKETYGEGNEYDFGARIYSSRTGRFLSLDPLIEEYPMISSYCFAANNPIRLIDINGEGPGDPFKTIDEAASDWAKTYNDNSIKNNVEYTSMIYSYKDENGTTMYSYSIPLKGNKESVGEALLPKTDGSQIEVANIHSHGKFLKGYLNNYFSPDDIAVSENKKLPEYLASPNGELKVYDPNSNAKYEKDRVRTINTDGSIPNDNKDPTQLSGEYCNKGYEDNISLLKIGKATKSNPGEIIVTAEPVYNNEIDQKREKVSYEPSNK